MKKWIKSEPVILAWRIGVLYLALALCRMAFLLYNLPEIDLSGDSAQIIRLIKGAMSFDTVSIVYSNALFIVLSLLPFKFRERKAYRNTLLAIYMTINSVVIAISLADAIYFRYTHKRFTADEIFFADNDNSLQLILKFAAENWYMVLYGAALITMLWLLYGRKLRPHTPIKNPIGYHVFAVTVLAAAAGLCIGGARGGFSRMTRPITLSNATQWASSPAQANLILSNPFCILRTASQSGKADAIRYFDQKTLDRIFTPYHYPAELSKQEASMPQSDATTETGQTGTPAAMSGPAFGSQKGKNVIIFILESFSAEHSAFLNPDLYPDGNGYTPFLDSLMRQGYTFTRAYANGHKSIEALPSILGSIPSFKTPFVLMPQSIGKSRQMPEILSEAGYATAFFCGSSRGSMGFEAYMRSAGVKEFFGKEDYEKERGKGDFDGYWGIWDQKFIDYMGSILNRTEQPFLSTIFTISSHHPFVVPDEYAERLPKGKTRIHRGVAYTDMAIHDFFEQYGSQEWFANSVFIFVADHVSSEKWAPKTKTETGRSHIIEFLYTPDSSLHGIDASTVQQTDIMPTMLGLLGIKDPYFAFGRDIFGERQRTPIAIKYANGYYAITDSIVMAFDEHEITALYSVSDTLLKHNLLLQPSHPDAEPLLRHTKAVIQQYYDHIKKQDYTVKE